MKEAGISGVQNLPTEGQIDGNLRANLEGTGMGYDKDIEMVREANRQDFFTSPFVFDAEDARKMAEARVDQLVAHVGLTIMVAGTTPEDERNLWGEGVG